MKSVEMTSHPCILMLLCLTLGMEVTALFQRRNAVKMTETEESVHNAVTKAPEVDDTTVQPRVQVNLLSVESDDQEEVPMRSFTFKDAKPTAQPRVKVDLLSVEADDQDAVDTNAQVVDDVKASDAKPGLKIGLLSFDGDKADATDDKTEEDDETGETAQLENDKTKKLQVAKAEDDKPKKEAKTKVDEEDDEEEADSDDDKREAALTKDVADAQKSLDIFHEHQKEERATLKHLEDQKASDKEIEANAKLVAKQTQSENLGAMMGDMWKELRMFEVPKYKEYMEAGMANESKAEASFKKELVQAKSKLSTLKDEEAKEDDEDDKATASTKAEATKNPEAIAEDVEVKDRTSDSSHEIFPVPTSSRCIVIIVCQYMIVFTALAMVRSWHELTGRPNGTLNAGLRSAAQTLTYGPMLCVLFLASRMRVENLSGGKDEPQMWVQNCMWASTIAVLASTVLVLVIPLTLGMPVVLTQSGGDVEMPQQLLRTWMVVPGGKATFHFVTAARYIILLALYVGIAGVIAGIFLYAPPGVSDVSQLPPVAPAINCTIILSVVFFFFQVVVVVCRTYTEFTGYTLALTLEVMTSAINAVEFAPQLAILFLAARMRALQHGAQPQEWAQSCMYSTTIALCATAFLACVVPCLMGGTVRTHPLNGEETFDVPNPMIGIGLVGLRFLCLVYFYGGAGGVIHSIYAFESPKGPEHTLAVSPTVCCVVTLTCQFFLVYFVQTVMLTVSEVSLGKYKLEKHRLFTALEAAKASLAFCPMLSIMFVTTRMYALLITDQKGAPPAWVQDGMYMATWSLLITFMAALASGLLVDTVETDEDGFVTSKFSNRYITMLMVVLRYLSMAMLYGGIALVIMGLFTMTPETANGRGSVPILSDVINSTPLGNPPPSAADIDKDVTY